MKIYYFIQTKHSVTWPSDADVIFYLVAIVFHRLFIEEKGISDKKKDQCQITNFFVKINFQVGKQLFYVPKV